MHQSRITALVLAAVFLAAPSFALANSAGDDQYVDPLAGQVGSDKHSGSHKSHKTGGSANSGSAPTASSPVYPPAAVSSAPEPVRSPQKETPKPIRKRAAVDISKLSGIGSLVAVPVKHVTLVLGDIAHERS